MSAPRVRKRKPKSGKRVSNIRLRKVGVTDLPKFFEHQRDPAANHMAAFGAEEPTDWGAFMAHWTKILRDPKAISMTVLEDGVVVGNVLHFELFRKPSIAYWYDRRVWGRGVATRALQKFLRLVPVRPLFARVAKDNVASVRVLEKCNFAVVGRARGFARARGTTIWELIFRRDAT